ncbi:MAG: hypothetical protein ACREWE_03940 [Gammaproteobacteria bacterium]
MALTRDFKDTIKARAVTDEAFHGALLTEALECFLSGDAETGKAVLRDYITIGFEALGEETGQPPSRVYRGVLVACFEAGDGRLHAEFSHGPPVEPLEGGEIEHGPPIGPGFWEGNTRGERGRFRLGRVVRLRLRRPGPDRDRAGWPDHPSSRLITSTDTVACCWPPP